MVKRSLAELTLQLHNVQQNLRHGRVFIDILSEIDDMIEQAPRQRRTPVSVPEVHPAFGEELVTLTNELHHHAPVISDDFIEEFLYYCATDNQMIRRHLLLFLAALLDCQDSDEDTLRKLYVGLSDPERMTAHITEPRNRAICGRTMSLMGLRMLLYADRNGRFFLSDTDVTGLVVKLAMVGLLERDNRGMINEEGWLHAYSAMPDLADELCSHNELVRGDKVLLLAIMVESYRLLGEPLAMGENDDLAEMILDLIGQHELYQQFFMAQLKNWQADLDKQPPTHESDWHRLFNYRRLMQSLMLDRRLPDEVGRQIWDANNQENG